METIMLFLPDFNLFLAHILCFRAAESAADYGRSLALWKR